MTTSLEVLITSEASGQMCNVCVWDLQSATSLLTYKGGTSCPHGIAVLANDYLVSSLNTKPILNFWPLHKKDNQQIKMVCPGRVTALDITPDGSYCIAAISEKIHIWQVCSGHLLVVLCRHYQNITCLSCTDDGSHFVSGGDDNLVIAWPLGRILAESPDQTSKKEPLHVWTQHSLPVTDVHVGCGGARSRVVSSSLDQTCRLWDMASGELLCTLTFDVSITSTAMDLAETSVFAGGNNGAIYSVKLYETPVKTERHITQDQEDSGCSVYRGHSKQVSCLSLSMDGSQLVSGSHDCNIKVWDVYTGQCTKTISQKGALTNVKVIPTPPGVSSDQKAQVSIEQFQRNLHVPSRDEDTSSDTLNLYLNRFKRGIDESDLPEGAIEELQKSSDKTDSQTSVIELKKTVKKLKTANQELFQYVAKNMLQEKPS